MLAIGGDAGAKRQNLLRPMISGRKILPQAVPAPRLAGDARAAVLFAISLAAAALIANFI